MVYVFGISGFVIGFLAGLFVIHQFLRSYSSGQLVRDKSLRWTYGLFVWVFAGLGSWLGVWFYERTFL